MKTIEKDLAENSPPKKLSFIKRHKKMFTILGVLVSIFGAFLVFIYLGSSKQREITHDFFEKLKNEEYDEAYQMTSEEFQESTSKKDLENFVESRNLNDDLKVEIDGVEMKKESGKSSRTMINGQIEFDDNICDLGFELIKKDSEWKVFGFELNDCENKNSV